MREDRTAQNILATGSAFSKGIATYYQGKSQAQLARSDPKAFLQYKNKQTRIGMIMLFVFLGLFVLMIIIVLIFVTRSSKKINSGEQNSKQQINKYKYQITPDYLQDDKTEKSSFVHKNIFRLWCDNDECGGRNIQNYKIAFKMTKKNMPEWKEIVFKDSEYDDFLFKAFGIDHPVTKAIKLINPVYGASRADLMRYLLIYKFGGLYIDVKSFVGFEIPDIPKDKDAWFSYWDEKYHEEIIGRNGEIQNWFVYAKKGSPIIKDIINEIVHNILSYHENQDYYTFFLTSQKCTTDDHKKEEILTITGPICVTTAINKSRHGKTIIIDNLIKNYIHYDHNTKIQFGKTHYSLLKDPLLISFKHTIPKIVYFTYNDINNIPGRVIENIKNYCAGFDIKIFDNDMCIGFLHKYYGQKATEIFINLESPAHKADFWRYCILYLLGGYYFDIKTVFQKPIRDIFKDDSKIMYTVLGSDEKHIYNGIIVTQPNNEIIWDALSEFYKYKKFKDYMYHCKFLYKQLAKYNYSLKIGTNELSNGWKCVLMKEECIYCDSEKCLKPPDRYNRNCSIKDTNAKVNFLTRYYDYPWKKDCELVLYENPFLKNHFIKWQNINDKFMQQNYPYTFDFDKEIKQHIIECLIDAPLDIAIIDCGCHIGDGSIPIASTLKRLGRDDIIIYAIDPSIYKINYVNLIKEKNNLYNLKTINTGLSDKIHEHTQVKNGDWDHNTGAMRLTSINDINADNNKVKTLFTSIDTLVKEKKINKHIYYIHLDIEGMELSALKGSIETLKIFGPILSIEEHNENDTKIREFLLLQGYRFHKRIIYNNIYLKI